MRRMTHTRPTIDVAGEQPGMLNDLIREVTVCEGEGGLAHVEMRFDNTAIHGGVGIDFAFEYEDTDVLRLGTAFRVLFPARDPEEDQDIPREVFSGRVSAIEFVATQDGMPEMVVLGEDLLMPLRMRRRTRGFEGASVRDLVSAVVDGTELSQPVVDYLGDEIVQRHQMDESDLAFLRSVLSDWDADVQVVDNTLQIAPRADIQRGEITLRWGEHLDDLRACADLAHQRAVFSMASYDHLQGTALRAEAELTAVGPGEGRQAAEYLENYGDTLCHLAAGKATTQEEAQALIDAHAARAVRRFVTAQGTAKGNPEIRVGAHLTLEGIGARFSNTYYCTKARHHFSRSTGYATEFEAECAYFKGEIAA